MKLLKFMLPNKLGEVLLRETVMLSVSLLEKIVSLSQHKLTEFIE